MAKNIRLTKANKIAINRIIATKQLMNGYGKSAQLAKQDGDEKNYKHFNDIYNKYLDKWVTEMDLLAEMNGMTWLELVDSKNYMDMRIANRHENI